MKQRVARALLVLSALSRAAAAQRQVSQVRDRFADLPEARLDSLYGPLLYLMHPDERGVYPALSVSGKRDYLRRFWARRDPSPTTPQNEVEDGFYARVSEANRRFHEGGAGAIPGWRTDRGRIFISYGPPDDVLSRPQPGPTLPYEVWKYTRGRGRTVRKFCFVDLTRFGNYVLVYAADAAEASQPSWRQLLGREAYEQVLRF